MTKIHLLIKKYNEILPDFALYFTFAKFKKFFHNIMYPNYINDLCQIIALCLIEYKNKKERSNAISREMYKFGVHILGFGPLKPIKHKKKYDKNPKKILTCDLCGKSKKEYMYKQQIPGKIICDGCYRKERRRNARS